MLVAGILSLFPTTVTSPTGYNVSNSSLWKNLFGMESSTFTLLKFFIRLEPTLLARLIPNISASSKSSLYSTHTNSNGTDNVILLERLALSLTHLVVGCCTIHIAGGSTGTSLFTDGISVSTSSSNPPSLISCLRYAFTV